MGKHRQTCPVCGRSALLRKFQEGKLGLHALQSQIQHFLGKGKIRWDRTDRSTDAAWLREMQKTLREVYRKLEGRLRALGEAPEPLEGTHLRPAIIERPPIMESVRVVERVPVIERVPLHECDRIVKRPKRPKKGAGK